MRQQFRNKNNLKACLAKLEKHIIWCKSTLSGVLKGDKEPPLPRVTVSRKGCGGGTSNSLLGTSLKCMGFLPS